jgi:uridine phosphorylase
VRGVGTAGFRARESERCNVCKFAQTWGIAKGSTRMVILNKRGRRDQQAAAEPEVNSTLSPSARARVRAAGNISRRFRDVGRDIALIRAYYNYTVLRRR